MRRVSLRRVGLHFGVVSHDCIENYDNRARASTGNERSNDSRFTGCLAKRR